MFGIATNATSDNVRRYFRFWGKVVMHRTEAQFNCSHAHPPSVASTSLSLATRAARAKGRLDRRSKRPIHSYERWRVARTRILRRDECSVSVLSVGQMKARKRRAPRRFKRRDETNE